jgi:glutaryl-CoA dehydrogenase
MHPIYTFGSEAMKDRLLPRLASGELVGCFGLSEPNAGSDPSAMTSNAVRKGDHWVLNGEKMWISNAPFADVFVVWVKDKADGKVKGFVLERGMPGLSTPKIEGKVSFRASHTGCIVMEDVHVPSSNQLDVTGLKGPFSCLSQARYSIAWGVVGAGEACFEIARSYLLQRVQFGVPLASKQLVQAKLVDMSTQLSLALLMAVRLGQLKEAGRVTPEAISMAKRNNCQQALVVARMARELLGGNGIIDENHVMRHMCNLESTFTYEGTHDMHSLILGRAITGIPAF